MSPSSSPSPLQTHICLPSGSPLPQFPSRRRTVISFGAHQSVCCTGTAHRASLPKACVAAGPKTPTSFSAFFFFYWRLTVSGKSLEIGTLIMKNKCMQSKYDLTICNIILNNLSISVQGAPLWACDPVSDVHTVSSLKILLYWGICDTMQAEGGLCWLSCLCEIIFSFHFPIQSIEAC